MSKLIPHHVRHLRYASSFHVYNKRKTIHLHQFDIPHVLSTRIAFDDDGEYVEMDGPKPMSPKVIIGLPLRHSWDGDCKLFANDVLSSSCNTPNYLMKATKNRF